MVKKIAIVLIILIGLFLRTYNLGNLPFAFSRDEAALGYNAWSLALTGKDEYGKTLPLILNSFNDDKPAVYSYLSIPFVVLGGLNETTTRLASALWGATVPLFVFLLVMSLSHDYLWAILASSIVVFSPWALEVNRTASEASLALSLALIGLFLFIQNRRRLQTAGVLLMLVTFFTYHTPRLVVPLLILGLFVTSVVKTTKSRLLSFVIMALVGSITLIYSFSRVSQVSIFTDPGFPPIQQEAIFEDGLRQTPVFLSRLWHTRYWYYLQAFIASYVKNSSLTYLFIGGTQPPRATIPETGQFQILLLPFFLFGLVFLVKRFNPFAKFVLWWLIVAPIPAALTFAETPNTYRTLFLLPAVAIIIAYGFTNSYVYLTNHFSYRIVGTLITTFLIFWGLNISKTWHQYVVHHQVHQPWYSQSGYRDLMPYLDSFGEKVSVTITDTEGEPYIYYLFYNHISPAYYQSLPNKRLSLSAIAQGADHWQLDNYTFSESTCPYDVTDTNPNHLYVVYHTCDLPSGYQRLQTISYLDGNPEFYVDHPQEVMP